jgi:hypothetical protein
MVRSESFVTLSWQYFKSTWEGGARSAKLFSSDNRDGEKIRSHCHHAF